MSEISNETGRQVGVLIDRKGRVEYVMVGSAKQIEMPDFGRARVSTDRFRGLRCVHTHLQNEALTQDDLTDLALLRLDLMAIIQVDRRTGLPGVVHAAHLVPTSGSSTNGVGDDADTAMHSTLDAAPVSDSSFEFLRPDVPSQLDVNFIELIESLEDEMARVRLSARNRQAGRDRAILINVTTGDADAAAESMAELRELAESAGVVVTDTIIQRRQQIDPRTLIGKGKLDDLLIRSMRLGADMLVFDVELSPTQVRILSEATDLKVLDRPQLILDIFAQRAQSREGKLQVELAQMKYLLPRLVIGQNSAFSRLAGGIGGRGPGETKLETDRRRVRDRISQLERQVDALGRQRQERRKSRSQKHLPIVSLVGYTNAGKSTLLNALTQSEVYAEKQMFATLDPTSRRLRLPREHEVIINDTVGFIRDLPEALVSAFRATLEEIVDSDVLIHVVDASNPRAEQQIESVDTILGDLGLSEKYQIIAYNKSDLVEPDRIAELRRRVDRDEAKPSVAVSAVERNSLRPLADLIADRLSLEFDEYAVAAVQE